MSLESVYSKNSEGFKRLELFPTCYLESKQLRKCSEMIDHKLVCRASPVGCRLCIGSRKMKRNQGQSPGLQSRGRGRPRAPKYV